MFTIQLRLPKVLSERSQNIVVAVRMAFDANIRFLQVISNGAERFLELTGVKEWQSNGQNILFRTKDDAVFYYLDHTSGLCTTLGFNTWSKRKETAVKLFTEFCREYKLEKVALELRLYCFFDLQMTHAEMGELMYGSLLPARESLPRCFANAKDGQALFESESGDHSYSAEISPLTVEQMTSRFNSIPNIGAFSVSPLLDTTIEDFHRQNRRENLYVQLRLKYKNVRVAKFHDILTALEEEADQLASETVGCFKSVPSVPTKKA
jgi:hypothetical protein